VQAQTCHQTKINNPNAFANMPKRYSPDVWGIRTYYRVFSLVNGGQGKEQDLFAGLR